MGLVLVNLDNHTEQVCEVWMHLFTSYGDKSLQATISKLKKGHNYANKNQSIKWDFCQSSEKIT